MRYKVSISLCKFVVDYVIVYLIFHSGFLLFVVERT